MLIQPGGLLALRELGALDAFAQASVPIHRLEGRSHRSWLLVDIPYAQDLPARAVTRPAMTRVLQQRAGELGVRLHLTRRSPRWSPPAIACCCAGANMSRSMKAR